MLIRYGYVLFANESFQIFILWQIQISTYIDTHGLYGFSVAIIYGSRSHTARCK